MDVTIPVPEDEFATTPYALIAPDGQLYRVESWGYHSETYGELEYAGILTRHPDLSYGGAVHVSDYDFDYIRDDTSRQGGVTQKQFDTMVAYMQACGETFPFNELVRIIDEKPKARKPSRAAANPFQQSAFAG